MYLRRFFGTLITFIAALALAAYAVLSHYDFNKFKPGIIEQVKNTTGRDLKLGGDIALSMGLKPALVVEEVSFQNVSWGSRPEMVKIKRFELQVALLPLIFGDIEVRRLVLAEPDILIEIHKSGKSNLDFGRDEKLPVQTSEKAPSSLPPIFYFKDTRITGGRLIYKDHRTGRSNTLKLESFRARAAKSEMPLEVWVKGVYEKRAFQFEGTTGPLVALLNAKETWPLKVRGKLEELIFSLDGQMRDVLKWEGFNLSVAVQGRSLQEVNKVLPVSDLPELGPFRVSAVICDPEGSPTVRDIKAHIGTEALLKVHLTGAIKDPRKGRGIDLRFSVQGRDAANLKKITKASFPIEGPFKASGRAVVAVPKTYKFSDLKVDHQQMGFEGYAEINLSQRKPSIIANLTSKKIDLRPLLSKLKKKRVRAVQTKTGRVFPRHPLPFHLLKQANAQIKVRAEKVMLPRLALSALNLDMIMQDGCLTFRRLKSCAGGGTVEGFFDVLPQGKAAKVVTEMRLRQVDVGTMFRQLKARRVMEGDLDADIDLEASGCSVAEFMASLSGKTAVCMGAGRIHNEYTKLLNADLAGSMSQLINPVKGNTEYTEFNCFVSGFKIRKGLADVTALVLDTDNASLIGDGRIDLKTEQLDLTLRPFPKKGIETGLFGKFSVGFGELAKPLKLGGTLAQPSVVLDPAQTAFTIGKAVGGVVLFGPMGIALALAGCNPGEENPCVAAIEAAKKGVKISECKKEKKEKSVDEKSTQGVKDAFEGVGTKIRKLFGG